MTKHGWGGVMMKDVPRMQAAIAEAVASVDSAAAIWEPSEAMRQRFPYAPLRDASEILDKLAQREPRVLACMHGSSYRGDGAALLRRLRDALAS